MAAGKGDRRRPQRVADEEFARRWASIFKDPLHCDRCGAQVENYQRGQGPIYCPWCDGVRESC